MKNKRLGIGVGIIFGTLIGLGFLLMPQHMVYFYLPDEALAQAAELTQQNIKVGGMVEANSLHWNPEALDLKFVLSDLKGSRIQVAYHGTPPDMFKENSGVVVEGKISSDGQFFKSHKLMVKHSEEYRAVGDGHSKDKELLEQSLFKG